MKEVMIQQRSPEWHYWRAGSDLGGIPRITATAASVISGLNPYQSPTDLWLQLMGFTPPKVVNAAMQRGALLEDSALACYNALTGLAATPICVEHDTYPWAAASLDGADAFRTRLVEIKCPGERTHALALSGRIPNYYWVQIQWQLFCTGFELGDYYSFDGNVGAPPITIKRDDAFLEQLFHKAEVFRQSLIDEIPPAGCDREVLAAAYKVAHAEAQSVVKKRDELGEALKAMAIITQSPFSTENGVVISSVAGRRSTDYKGLFQAHGITDSDVEKFVSQGNPSWRIEVVEDESSMVPVPVV